MTLQVLVSTMFQTDYSLLAKMNINSDAIIVNQCDTDCVKEFDWKNHRIVWICSSERGIGVSRNTALMRATADVLLFADDDIVYCDDYVVKVLSFFERYNADVSLFNFNSLNIERPEYIDTKKHRVGYFNCLKYGAFRIAINRTSVLKNNLFFSLLFGGGAPYQAGEDNLFLVQAIRGKLKVIASSILLGTVEQKSSTWFKGYDEHYFFDRGFLFGNMFGHLGYLLLFLIEIKSNKKLKTSLPFNKRISAGYSGIKKYLNT